MVQISIQLAGWACTVTTLVLIDAGDPAVQLTAGLAVSDGFTNRMMGIEDAGDAVLEVVS